MENYVSVIWFVLVALWLAMMFISSRPQRTASWLGFARRSVSRDNRWHFAIFLALSGVAFGMVGHLVAVCPDRTMWPGVLINALYEGVTLVTNNGTKNEASLFWFELAKINGIALAVLVTYEIITRVFTDSIRSFRLSKLQGHVVICGLGSVGYELALDCLETGRAVVVVERDTTPHETKVAELRGLGAIVVQGDATSRDVLTQVRATHATDLFFVTGSDERNMDGEITAKGLPSQTGPLPTVRVHLTRPELETALIHQAKSDRASRQPELVMFSVWQSVITDLFDGSVFEHRPRAPGPLAEGGEVAHFVILGFTEVGEQLLLRVANQCHYENLKRSRVTVVYSPGEQGRVDAFRRRFPKMLADPETFAEGADTGYLEWLRNKTAEHRAWNPLEAMDDWSFGVRVREIGVHSPDDRGVEFSLNGAFVQHPGEPFSPGVIDHVRELCLARGVRPMIFFCHESDEFNSVNAFELREQLDLRLKVNKNYLHPDHRAWIFPYVPNRSGLSSIVSRAYPGEVIPFGDSRSACTFDRLTDRAMLDLAETIAQMYTTAVAKGAPSTLDTLQSWARRSNLLAAQHGPTKRAIHASHPSREDLGTPDTPGEPILTLMKIEHNRYLAERVSLGWKLGAKNKPGEPENCCRVAMVDWEHLTQQERLKDQLQVNCVLRLDKPEAPARPADPPAPAPT